MKLTRPCSWKLKRYTAALYVEYELPVNFLVGHNKSTTKSEYLVNTWGHWATLSLLAVSSRSGKPPNFYLTKPRRALGHVNAVPVVAWLAVSVVEECWRRAAGCRLLDQKVLSGNCTSSNHWSLAA